MQENIVAFEDNLNKKKKSRGISYMKKPIGIDSSLLLTRRGICNAQKTSCLREMTVKVPVVNYMKIPVVNFMKIIMKEKYWGVIYVEMQRHF